jgi:TonB family protein
MKNALLLIVLISILTSNSYSQTAPPVQSSDNDKVFTVVENMPQFPGGEEALMQFLAKNIKYPQDARKNNITGRVYVTFVVDKDGKVKDIRILRGIGGGCDEEVLRVMHMMPDWKAGSQDGSNVSVQYNLPVHFTLPEKDEKKREPK